MICPKNRTIVQFCPVCPSFSLPFVLLYQTTGVLGEAIFCLFRKLVLLLKMMMVAWFVGDHGVGTGPRPGAPEGAQAGHLGLCKGSARKIAPFSGSGVLILFLLSASANLAQAVTCNTCMDTLSGCTGGVNCPLLTGPTANAATLTSSSATGSIQYVYQASLGPCGSSRPPGSAEVTSK